MLASFTAAKQALFRSGLYATHLRVTVGAQDMTATEGLDWVAGAQISQTNDQAIATAQIALRRRFGHLSLATLMDLSKLNAGGTLVDVAKAVEVFGAITPQGMQPASADWVSVFKGKIGRVDWGRDPIALDCYDLGGVLERCFIEVQRVYGSGAGVAVEDVIQDILTDNGTGVTLYSITGDGGTPFKAADSPGWMLKTYKQSKESVMSAIRRLALQIGWEVRYRWNASVSDWVLTLYDPMRRLRARGTMTLTGQPSAGQHFTVNLTAFTARAAGAGANEFNLGSTVTETCDNIVSMLAAGTEGPNIATWRIGQTVVVEWNVPGTAGNAIHFTEAMSNTTADGAGHLGGTIAGRNVPASVFTFAASDYSDLPRSAVDDQDVRNAVKVVITNADDGLRTAVVKTDATSIARYGRRYMELALGSTDRIDTLSEAHSLAAAALEDLREPDALVDADIIGPFLWGELGDIMTFAANGEHFDSPQELAVQSITMKLATLSIATTLTTCGRPGGGAQRWMECEGGRGAGPAVDEYQDAAPEGMSATAGLASIIVEFDDPRTMEPPLDDWAYTRVHVSTVNGFTPNTSNLAAVGKQTRFEIHALIPGTTYYAKALHIDSLGNVGATSAQVSAATQEVGAYHENTDKQNTNLVPNGCFGQNTLGPGYPPDRWEVTDGAWGVEVLANTTESETGGHSVELTDDGAGDGEITSDFIPVTVYEEYSSLWVVKASEVTGGADDDIEFAVRYYDKDKAFISEVRWQDLSINTWYPYPGGMIPANALASSVRYVRFVIGRYDAHGGLTYHLFVDRLVFMKQYHKFMADQVAGQSIASGAPTVVPFFQIEFDKVGGMMDGVYYGFDYDPVTGLQRFTANQAGTYSFQAGVELASMSAGKTLTLEFWKNGALERPGGSLKMAAAGNGRVLGSALIDLVRGDYVEVRLTHDEGAALNTTGGYANFFCGSLLPGSG